MTQPSNTEENGKKRTIEFDMFVRDLEPEAKEDVRGGSDTTKPPTPVGNDNRH